MAVYSNPRYPAMLTVLFRLEGESARNAIAVPNEDTLLNVCYAFEHSKAVANYTVIDSENTEPGVITVAVFGWDSSSFPKFIPHPEF